MNGEAIIEEMDTFRGTKLKVLELKNCYHSITDTEGCLSKILKNNVGLEHLNMSGSVLGDNVVYSLAEAIKEGARLTVLNLTNNDIG